MRTTLAIDDELLAEARLLTGMQQKSALIHEALKSLIARGLCGTWAYPSPGSLLHNGRYPRRRNPQVPRPDSPSYARSIRAGCSVTGCDFRFDDLDDTPKPTRAKWPTNASCAV